LKRVRIFFRSVCRYPAHPPTHQNSLSLKSKRERESVKVFHPFSLHLNILRSLMFPIIQSTITHSISATQITLVLIELLICSNMFSLFLSNLELLTNMCRFLSKCSLTNFVYVHISFVTSISLFFFSKTVFELFFFVLSWALWWTVCVCVCSLNTLYINSSMYQFRRFILYSVYSIHINRIYLVNPLIQSKLTI